MSLDVPTCTRLTCVDAAASGTDDEQESYRLGVWITRVGQGSRPEAGNGVMMWGLLAGASPYVVVAVLVVFMGTVLVITRMVKNSAHPMWVRLRFLGFEVSLEADKVDGDPPDSAAE